MSNVSSATPQVSYSLTMGDIRAQLSRKDWLLSQGVLQLSPGAQWRQEHVNVLETVTFPVSRLFTPWRPSAKEDHILITQLFSLLAKHRLLEHPELLLTEKEEHLRDAQEALSLLRVQTKMMLDAKHFQGLYCQECEKHKWSTLTSQQRYRIYWHNRVIEEICPHTKLLAPVMNQLFTQFPELLFELLSLIAPEIDLKSREKPSRFTLTRYAFLASMGQRLLGLDTQPNEEHWSTEEGEKKRPRLSAKLSPEEKKRFEMIQFSASAWGYTGRVEALLEDDPDELYPTLGGAPLPPKIKKELTIPPTEAPIEAKQPAPTPEDNTLSMDAKIFLQEIGDNNDTLAEMMLQMKLLAPSIQKQLMRLPMKKVIELWFDLEQSETE
jgi:hypothetical protein